METGYRKVILVSDVFVLICIKNFAFTRRVSAGEKRRRMTSFPGRLKGTSLYRMLNWTSILGTPMQRRNAHEQCGECGGLRVRVTFKLRNITFAASFTPRQSRVTNSKLDEHTFQHSLESHRGSSRLLVWNNHTCKPKISIAHTRRSHRQSPSWE